LPQLEIAAGFSDLLDCGFQAIGNDSIRRSAIELSPDLKLTDANRHSVEMWVVVVCDWIAKAELLRVEPMMVFHGFAGIPRA
jgi:hypothetical protein